MKRFALAGFYAVLDRDDEALARGLVGPRCATILQVRVKPGDAADIMRIARMARRVCTDAGARLVINDRIDVALAVGADGVHLGQLDVALADTRTLRSKLFIGVSTHDVDQVARAVGLGADYLGFGPIFATTTKANPDPLQGLAGLRAAVAVARGTPIVAIGGVTSRMAPALYAAGAAAVCAIGAVNTSLDIRRAARAMGRTSPWPGSASRYAVLRKT